jgi:hypothetical protein
VLVMEHNQGTLYLLAIVLLLYCLEVQYNVRHEVSRYFRNNEEIPER